MLRRSGRLLVVLVACSLGLVLLPTSPASAAVTETYQGGKCGWISVGLAGHTGGTTTGTDRLGCLSGNPVSGPPNTSHRFYWCSEADCNDDPGTTTRTLILSNPVTLGSACPTTAGSYSFSGSKLIATTAYTGTICLATITSGVVVSTTSGTLKLPASGTTLADPSVRCDGFTSVQAVVSGGTLDLSWRWAGTLPTRGWRVTDAGPGADAGSGTQRALIPTTPLTTSGGSRYGLVDWTVPSGVNTLRFESRSDARCYIGYSVQRDGSGNVTGVTVSGAPVDVTPEEDATDENGNSCSMLDLPCHLKWLLIPDPDSWGWSEVSAGFGSRPPFNVLSSFVGGVSTFVTQYASGSCGNLPDWGTNQGFEGAAGEHSEFITCGDPGMGLSTLRTLVSIVLYVVSGIYVFRMVQGGFDK